MCWLKNGLAKKVWARVKRVAENLAMDIESRGGEGEMDGVGGKRVDLRYYGIM